MNPIRTFNGKTPVVGPEVWVDPSAVVIGDVVLGEGASVWPLVAIRGDIHHIHIGARTNIQDGSVLHVTHASRFNPAGFPVEIADDVTVGHKVMLHGCRIGHHCLIGMGSIILDGATLEPYTMLGAGALVSPGKTLEGGHLWLGSPARCVRPLTEKEREHIDYLALNYARLARAYRTGEPLTV